MSIQPSPSGIHVPCEIVFPRPAIALENKPLKGRFAHILCSSEDFIRDKRYEVELEDRADAIEALKEEGEVTWAEVKRKHGL